MLHTPERLSSEKIPEILIKTKLRVLKTKQCSKRQHSLCN